MKDEFEFGERGGRLKMERPFMCLERKLRLGRHKNVWKRDRSVA